MVDFRFSAKNAFLTYAQCPIDKAQALLLLSEKRSIEEYVVAEELHQDGGRHLHCFLQFTSKLDTRDSRYFDLLHDGHTYHPNITKPRSVKNVITYIQKDGDFLVSHGLQELIEKKSWGQLRAEATTVGEYLNRVERYYPRDFALNYERLKVYAEATWKDEKKPFQPVFTDFNNVPDLCKDWRDQYVPIGPIQERRVSVNFFIN